MRSRVIPAQITTVEDRIAGNFSLTQVMFLLAPVLLIAFIYTFLPPKMIFVWYKLGITIISTIFFITLAIRVKGRIVASWLVVLVTYNLRPKYYVIDKNDLTHREVIKPEFKKEVQKVTTQAIKKRTTINKLNIQDVLQLNHLLDRINFNLIYRTGKKGGLNVAFEKISK
jgi:hypothetical protein